ncbi:unnamed protein product [Owenia fusiformis]|uniref:RNA methyltransferase n=1 Tax=Owenia fusiformis TaxID=6347 RepID=A0A8J1U846_OWEFU|nr:unnamed protein product [Owenia fusiformis]
MSVDVKTPTRTQFEHAEFHCGEKMETSETSVTTEELRASVEKFTTAVQQHKDASHGSKQNVKQNLQRQMSAPFCHLNNSQKKRRYSQSNQHFKRRKYSNKEKMVLPTRFLLGGNINDPLNLNSMIDDKEVNRKMNAETPQSSPLPPPLHRQNIEVRMPTNISDPLNLNSGDDILVSPKSGSKKKKRNKSRKKSSMDDNTTPCQDDSLQNELFVDTETPNKATVRKDEIVSPVIPQASPKARRKKHHSSGDGRPEPSSIVSRSLLREDSNKSESKTQQQKSSQKKGNKFVYGNYNRYYGYRNPHSEEDNRLNLMKSRWFEDMDVLDIGCNVGHITLSIARDFKPKKITGIDIDSNLISIARKNIRHYISKEKHGASDYPVSMSVCYGPLAAPKVPIAESPGYPNNVMFVQGNYVLESDELLDLQKEEYDIIMALSITKWIHLNWGDAGMKRFFKRISRQLRPGGRFILEPQAWASYKKKNTLTETIQENYKNIKFKPEQFTEYLLSREVGFSTCETLDVPFNKSKGFRRSMLMFRKTDTAFNTPMDTPYGWGTPIGLRPDTPLRHLKKQRLDTPDKNTPTEMEMFGWGTPVGLRPDTPSTPVVGAISGTNTPDSREPPGWATPDEPDTPFSPPALIASHGILNGLQSIPENTTSAPIGQNNSPSPLIGQDNSASNPNGEDNSASNNIDEDISASIPIGQESNASANISQENDASVNIGHDISASAPTGEDNRADTPTTHPETSTLAIPAFEKND